LEVAAAAVAAAAVAAVVFLELEEPIFGGRKGGWRRKN